MSAYFFSKFFTYCVQTLYSSGVCEFKNGNNGGGGGGERRRRRREEEEEGREREREPFE